MLWIVGMLGLTNPSNGPSTIAPGAAQVKVSARIVRGAEASEGRTSVHRANRIRKVVEKLPDGRTINLVVFDFE